jgi:hypothetical protein
MAHRLFEITYRTARRVVIGLVGGTIVLIGLFLIVLPGPALVVIPLGLAILGLEFGWARRWLGALKRKSKDTIGQLGRSGSSRNPRERKSE